MPPKRATLVRAHHRARSHVAIIEDADEPGPLFGHIGNHPDPHVRELVSRITVSVDEIRLHEAPKSSMAYIAPIHRASGVRLALRIHFLEPDKPCLVVTKANRLEFYSFDSNGLMLRHSKIIYGQVVMVESLRPHSANTDHLFIGTDRHAYFTISWDAAKQQLKTERSYVDLSERIGRDSQSYDRCFIDPLRRFLTLNLLEGVLTLIPIPWKQPRSASAPQFELGNLAEEPWSIRIPEILIRSSTYLHYKNEGEKEKARIATLYEDNQERAWLKIRDLSPEKDLSSADLDNEKMLLIDRLDPTASHLIPVPQPVNGLLVLSETAITWVNDEDHSKVQPLAEATIWTAWTQIEENRWLLADEFGYLYFLMLSYDSGAEILEDFELDKLGRASRASVLTYLSNGFVFIGSHSGDSQVVQITSDGINVVQTLQNVAPIVDFTVMDMGRGGEGQVNEYSSGQARLVTGSGAFQDGSLRSMRSGVGVEDIGSFDLSSGDQGSSRAAIEIFHLKALNGGKATDALLVSYVDSSRVFMFDQDSGVEEIYTLATDQPTVLAQNVEAGQRDAARILQCTNRNVNLYLSDHSGLRRLGQWSSPDDRTIVAASASEKEVAISLGGTELVVLHLSTQGPDLPVLGRRTFVDPVSCINLPNIAPGFLLAGFWNSADLAILRIPDLEPLHSTKIGDDTAAVPRSVLLTQILPGQPPTLFVALADGNIVTFSVTPSNFELSGRQTTVLGTQPATLKVLPRSDNLFSVFAIAEHSTLVYGAENRLVFSAVTAEEATCICSFDSQAFPGAVALATPKELKLAMIEKERTTHIQTLHIGGTVRRIAYSPDLRTFGIGTIRRKIEDGAEVITSHFVLADEINFKTLSEHALNHEEIVESVCRMMINEDGRKVERFVVGTVYLDETPENGRGRLIVFEVTEDKMLKVVTEVALKGACRALAMVEGKIVACLVKTVVVFAYELGGLQKRAAFRISTAPIDVYVNGNLIVVSDLMKSVSVLQYTRGLGGAPDKLTEVARHFAIVWSTAIAPVDRNTTLESDAEGNLIVLRQNVSGVTADDKRRLETISEMQLGEQVNKIKPIDIQASSSAIVAPRAFLATVNGGVYLFGMINPDKQNLLMNLQTNIAKYVNSPGNIPWGKWRGFKSPQREEVEPLRFVDGELVERFLDCGSELQAKIVEGLGTGAEDMVVMIESLRRMH